MEQNRGTVAYQAETDRFILASPHYARTDDDRPPLIHSVLLNAWDLKASKSELRVSFARKKSHTTKKGFPVMNWKPLLFLEPAMGFEPATY